MVGTGQCQLYGNPNVGLVNGCSEHKRKGYGVYGSKVCSGSGQPPRK